MPYTNLTVFFLIFGRLTKHHTMKRIIGLDLGTNSIGWAIINNDEQGIYHIEKAGSRIIPMDAAKLGDFDKGNSTSQTSERTSFRSIRRLLERCLLRRERLHRVLNILGFLPEHYAKQIDSERNPGKFIKGKEPKLAWMPNPETGSTRNAGRLHPASTGFHR